MYIFFIVDCTSVVYYTRATSVCSTMSESSAAYSSSFIWIYIVYIINFYGVARVPGIANCKMDICDDFNVI